MKRTFIFYLIAISLTLVTMLSMPPQIFLSSESYTSQNNWILEVNTTIATINQNQVKLKINYTEIYLSSFYFPSRTRGGYFLWIDGANISWTPYTASQYIESNVYQPKGVFSSFYSITFNKTNQLYLTNYIGGTDFIMNFVTSGNYTLHFNPNREISSYIALLNLQTSPNVGINVSPANWQATGFIQNSPPSQSSHSANNSSSSLTTDAIPLIIMLIISSSFLVRKKKL